MGKRTTLNLRIYKKKAKAAMRSLIKDHGISPTAFFFGEKDDVSGYEVFGEIDSPNPLKGTPFYFPACNVSGGIEVYCCVDWLKDLEMWSAMTSDEAQKILEGK